MIPTKAAPCPKCGFDYSAFETPGVVRVLETSTTAGNKAFRHIIQRRNRNNAENENWGDQREED